MATRKFRKQEIPNLPLDKLHHLTRVFNEQEWKIEDHSDSCFNKYAKLLGTLENEEQTLVLELTNRFLHIEQPSYISHLVDAVNIMLENMPDVTICHILPALAKSDVGKTGKSSQMIQYLFKGDELRGRIEFDEVNFNIVMDINKFKSKKKILLDNELILFVDDFIGSGETALEALDILEDTPFPKEKICFLSIVIHRMGKNIIEDAGYKVFYAKEIHKGISDHYIDEELKQKSSVMQKIEKRIPKLNKNFMFGYRQCEALVCMHRIPNNTFPIYWLHEGVSPYKR